MSTSRFAIEAREAATGARRQLEVAASALAELDTRLRARPPSLVVTCGRGSSDHATTYGKYLLETTVGRVVASVGPSVASLYNRTLALDGALFVSVSQSGRSPDVLRTTEAARRGGALVVGLVNDQASPLVQLCDVVIPLCAGDEHSVPATKSFLLACLGFLQLAACWSGDPVLRDAVAQAPDALDAACALDWDLGSLASATSVYVVGRGLGLGAAFELALKLKETCRLHAEAFSAAELAHGPIALVERGFPAIVLGQPDETERTTRELAARLVALGASVRSTLDVDGAQHLPTVPDVPSVLSPLCQVQSFYLAIPALAASRGLDPNAPPYLEKATQTI